MITFEGLWIDGAGRALLVESHVEGFVATFTAGVDGPCLERPRLLLGRKPTRRMPARIVEERLVVEAGEPGLGPTYELHPDGDGLVPEIVMGLYDDYDDDLGVPWAMPLARFRRGTEAELAKFRAYHASWLVAPLPRATARRR